MPRKRAAPPCTPPTVKVTVEKATKNLICPTPEMCTLSDSDEEIQKSMNLDPAALLTS